MLNVRNLDDLLEMWDKVLLGYGITPPGPINTIRVMRRYKRPLAEIIMVLMYHHGLNDAQAREELRSYARLFLREK